MDRAEKRIPPPVDPAFKTLEVHVKGERGHVVGRATVPVELLLDFESCWQHFREKYPQWSLERFLRYVLIKGTIVAVRRVTYNTIPEPNLFFKELDEQG